GSFACRLEWTAPPCSSSSNDTPPTGIYTLSLHDALPICEVPGDKRVRLLGVLSQANQIGVGRTVESPWVGEGLGKISLGEAEELDRKSTRLNSSHVAISYAVFCLKKKRRTPTTSPLTTRN